VIATPTERTIIVRSQVRKRTNMVPQTRLYINLLVTPIKNHLRWQIQRGSAKCVREVRDILSKAKIDNDRISVVGDENILRLEVAL
jgi:hypothetical protein